MSALLAEKKNVTLSLSFVNIVQLFSYYVLYCILLCIMYAFNLLSVYHCVNKGYQK
jgi:hypothetical protein